jgi:hypothetical protein
MEMLFMGPTTAVTCGMPLPGAVAGKTDRGTFRAGIDVEQSQPPIAKTASLAIIVLAGGE